MQIRPDRTGSFAYALAGVKKNTPLTVRLLYASSHRRFSTSRQADSGIGITKLRAMSNDENCQFVLWNGAKRLIKRRELDKYTDKAYSI